MGMNFRGSSGAWLELADMPGLFDTNQPLVREKTEKYSLPFGDVEFRQIVLPETYIVFGDMCIRDRRLQMEAPDFRDIVELHFVLTGKGVITQHVANKPLVLAPNRQNMFYTPVFSGCAEYDPDVPYRFFEIHFTREKFLHLVQDCGPTLQTFCDHIIAGEQMQLSEQGIPSNSATQQCIHSILNCPYQGGLKLLFLQSKCVELLVLQAEAYDQYLKNNQKSALKSNYDRDRIQFVRDYLIANAVAPPSLSELAQLSGLNEFKLKKGFREVFNDSIINYVNEYKLLQAKEQLLSHVPIKHVAEELGYSSIQYFSKMFKKKFGVSPGLFTRDAQD
ncbi:helix-turn-helix transcriptional regulator [Chitinophaga sp. G-6-1-13]|uniref:Helix-turn-helix transcriptional regulator n=1 Tax=Chitinophaga fulva TaxID=2728842 RepID=A0A848GU83_9BACT|nr:AraC family transcriptional regulator [Chitinophaga fulva]NML41041.1 helix-turn-helix transcriptional regulator [Chitinophaga fulva]